MASKKKKTLDFLQKKEDYLNELVSQSDLALRVVLSTIDDLDTINQNIDSTITEIDTYLKQLSDTRKNLFITKDKNQKVMQNFSKLLCLDK